MKYLVIMSCIVLVFLTACDKREGEKPILVVIPGPATLYNVANHDTINIAVQMTGSNSLISNQAIDVIYDTGTGLFVGSGANNLLVTNEQGYAQGFFKVEDGFYGNITMKFSPNHFPAQAKTIILPALDMPKITILTAADTMLTTVDAITLITVGLTSHSSNFSDQTIRYSTTVGTDMENLTSTTDALGVATNNFHRNSFTGNAIISVHSDVYPEDIHYLTVHCQ
jgi:hypothetical protein